MAKKATIYTYTKVVNYKYSEYCDKIPYMPAPWTEQEKYEHKKQLTELYSVKNLTIGDISKLLGIKEGTVFDRLKRLGITTTPEKKLRYQNKRNDIVFPTKHTNMLAELFGILLGDGHISHFQTVVTLGNKELAYAQYVASLFKHIFGVRGNISIRNGGYRDVYLGSTEVTKWFFKNGLVSHKVKSQVGVPVWIMNNPKYAESFLRGFFDTDGSVYALVHGIQISFCNASLPLLQHTRTMLLSLGYRVSKITGRQIYITNKISVDRFFKEINPANKKHIRRFKKFQLMRRYSSGNEGRL